ncbi:MAG: long-chain fatty acid--CoA ligase, partial [Planctomycetota bacterium]
MHPILGPIEENAARRPQRIAASDPAGEWTYADLTAALRRMAARLARTPPDRRIGILAPTSALHAAAILACWRAGRTPTPLNFLLPSDVLARVIADAEIGLLLAAEPFAPLAEQLPVESAKLESLAGEAKDAPPPADAPSVAPNDLAALLYTSGTSGDPKGVRLTFGNLAENVRASIAHLKLAPDQQFVGLLPQFHSFGFTMTTLLPLMLGASIAYLPRFSPVGLVETIRQRRVTILIAVASMYGALLKLRDVASDAFASVRLAISGGEPLPASVAAAFEQRFGVPILEGWGLTETSPVVSVNTPWNHKPGSVGKPIPDVGVCAVDEQRRPLPAGRE